MSASPRQHCEISRQRLRIDTSRGSPQLKLRCTRHPAGLPCGNFGFSLPSHRRDFASVFSAAKDRLLMFRMASHAVRRLLQFVHGTFTAKHDFSGMQATRQFLQKTAPEFRFLPNSSYFFPCAALIHASLNAACFMLFPPSTK